MKAVMEVERIGEKGIVEKMDANDRMKFRVILAGFQLIPIHPAKIEKRAPGVVFEPAHLHFDVVFMAGAVHRPNIEDYELPFEFIRENVRVFHLHANDAVGTRKFKRVVDQIRQDLSVSGEELFEDEVVFGAQELFHGGDRIPQGPALWQIFLMGWPFLLFESGWRD